MGWLVSRGETGGIGDHDVIFFSRNILNIEIASVGEIITNPTKILYIYIINNVLNSKINVLKSEFKFFYSVNYFFFGLIIDKDLSASELTGIFSTSWRGCLA